MKKPPPKMLTMADIRTAEEPKEEQPSFRIHTLKRNSEIIKKRRLARPTAPLIVFSVLMVGVFGFYAARAMTLKKLAENSTNRIYTELNNAQSALKKFDPRTAQESFEHINNDVLTLYNEADRFGLLRVAEFGGSFIDILRRIPASLKSVLAITEASVTISREATLLKSSGLTLMLEHRGEELISKLKLIQAELKSLPDKIASLDADGNNFKEIVGNNLLATQLNIQQGSQLLDALIAWLDSPLERHIAVFFENPSEIRPGGGFIGSFADIAIQKGNVNHIKVNDIYDPDGQLESNIIPPEPLQLITKRWGARDANWFFDFPTSAKKTISFLNDSKIYQEQKNEFEGAVAINVHVIRDIFSVTGPIQIPEYDLTLDADSFLSEVQREVETGDDKAVGEPKRILKVLAPLLIEKLANLDDIQKSNLIKVLRDRIITRDIRIYIDDVVLQQYLKQFNLAGEMYDIPLESTTDYLAVANANIAGGKTDAVIKQKINLISTISLEGAIINTLTLSRTHQGDKETDPWYRVTNKNYVQVFTPSESQPLTLTGRSKWPDQPEWEYESFTNDTEVDAMYGRATYDENLGIDVLPINEDISAFAFWFNTERGKTNTVELSYEHPKKLNLTNRTPYRFVFERQPGIQTSLHVTIDAPPGFIWEEIGSSTYTLENENPNGRIIVDLTLIPLP